VVLGGQLICPHSKLARPSLSALGLNFTLLTETLGWDFRKIDAHAASANDLEMGLMAGIVLLG
jgi:hypothetical protein